MVTIKSRLTFGQFHYFGKLSTADVSIMARTRNSLTTLPCLWFAAQEKHLLEVFVPVQRCQRLFLVISVHVEILKI